MTTTRERIIDRIHKLLALANSANEHESRAAAEKANELLLRYNLDLQQVRAASGDMGASLDDDYEARQVYDSKLRTPQQRFIFVLLREHFFVRIIHNRTEKHGNVRYTFVGEKANVAVAAYVHDFLLTKFPELWRDYAKRTGAPLQARQSYYIGLFRGLDAQFRTKRTTVQSETGLVVVDDPNVDRYLQHLYGDGLKDMKGRRQKVGDAAAYAAGDEDGRKLKINRALGERADAPNAPRLALGGKK